MLDRVDYIWVVPKDSEFGRRLSSFTPLGLQTLKQEFERRFVLSLAIAETDDVAVRNGVYMEFPRFELSFDAHTLLYGHFASLERLAFHLGSSTAPQPE